MKDVYYTDSVLVAYMRFHYGRGIRELVGVARNFLWFIAHFFSFSLLLRTLFAPWHRMGEMYGSIINFEAFFSTFVVNMLMRAVGFITRVAVLMVGMVAYVLTAIGAGIMFVVWLTAPLLLIGMIVLSVTFFAL